MNMPVQGKRGTFQECLPAILVHISIQLRLLYFLVIVCLESKSLSFCIVLCSDTCIVFFMTVMSTLAFVRVHNWKSRLLIVHSADLIYRHWQTENIESQEYLCSYRVIYYHLLKRDSSYRTIIHSQRQM